MIEEKNLQRQELFTKRDIGKSKAIQAKKILKNKNIKAYDCFITEKTVSLLKCDLILDCTDNLKTRFIINEHAVKNNIPWIYTSLSETTGCIFTIVPGKTPCFYCIFKEKEIEEYCIEINPKLADKIAEIQVQEAEIFLKKQPYTKELRYYTLEKNLNIKVKKDQKCSICEVNK